MLLPSGRDDHANPGQGEGEFAEPNSNTVLLIEVKNPYKPAVGDWFLSPGRPRRSEIAGIPRLLRGSTTFTAVPFQMSLPCAGLADRDGANGVTPAL